MNQISVDDVVYIHDHIIAASGGLTGLRDKGQLKACLARPFQSAFGEETYPDLFEKAAALLDCIANDHPFADGNKRTAMASAVIFLVSYGISTDFTNQEYEDFMLHVVNDKPSIQEIANWLRQHGDIII
ncbi:MAG TPA: type II toxin-antitoxin system death-on-curing family toxin [Candidatus Saccharimonadales bacterium]|nr:type II toxin-antitoxin system death-on-curing family toxin [Candidatus Saccharimonadales bacterium]